MLRTNAPPFLGRGTRPFSWPKTSSSGALLPRTGRCGGSEPHSPEELEANAPDWGAAAIAVLAGPLDPSPAPRSSAGDGNADGTADLSDAILVLDVPVPRRPVAACGGAADANDDGDIDISTRCGSSSPLRRRKAAAAIRPPPAVRIRRPDALGCESPDRCGG